MFQKHLIFLATILLTIYSPQYGAAEVGRQEEQVWVATQIKAKELLSRRPIYIKEDRPQATIGVIPYAIFEGEIWVLLGRETKDNAWCDFGGKFEPKDASFEAGIVREFKEETAEVYSLDKIPTEGALILYIDKQNKREIIYAVCRVEYVPEHVLLAARGASLERESKDKDRFQWFSLHNFIKLCTTSDPVFPLRKFFQQDFVHSSKFKEIIDFLMRQQYLLKKTG